MFERVRRVPTRQFAAGSARRGTDSVAVEEPLEIRTGSSPLAVTMRTPGEDIALAAGFLHGEGIVRRPEEILLLRHCRDGDHPGNVLVVELDGPASGRLAAARRSFATTSACGVCGRETLDDLWRRSGKPREGPVVSHSTLLSLPERLRDRQEVFASTGGLHAAGLFDAEGSLILAHEDIGRHNAVDKVLGRMFLDGRMPLSESILLVSGRASFEIAQKALAAGVPILAAVSAPSSLAVDLALGGGMTLVGFLRETGFRVYSAPERIAT